MPSRASLWRRLGSKLSLALLARLPRPEIRQVQQAGKRLERSHFLDNTSIAPRWPRLLLHTTDSGREGVVGVAVDLVGPVLVEEVALVRRERDALAHSPRKIRVGDVVPAHRDQRVLARIGSDTSRLGVEAAGEDERPRGPEVALQGKASSARCSAEREREREEDAQ